MLVLLLFQLRDKVTAKPLCLAATANKHQIQLALSHTTQARRARQPAFQRSFIRWTNNSNVNTVSQSPPCTLDFVFCTALTFGFSFSFSLAGLYHQSVFKHVDDLLRSIYRQRIISHQLLTSVKANVTIKYSPGFTLNCAHSIFDRLK